MIQLNQIIGQLTGEPVNLPPRPGRVFLESEFTGGRRTASEKAKAANSRRAAVQSAKIRSLILAVEGQFTRTQLKEKRIVPAAASTIHRICQQLKDEKLIQLIHKEGKTEIYEVVNHGQQKTAQQEVHAKESRRMVGRVDCAL